MSKSVIVARRTRGSTGGGVQGTGQVAEPLRVLVFLINEGRLIKVLPTETSVTPTTVYKGQMTNL